MIGSDLKLRLEALGRYDSGMLEGDVA